MNIQNVGTNLGEPAHEAYQAVFIVLAPVKHLANCAYLEFFAEQEFGSGRYQPAFGRAIA